MSHHVCVRLPDGRDAWADYRQPIVHVMRRHLARVMAVKTGTPADLADLALIGQAMDATPELFCRADACRLHGPASSEPYTPPRYQPGQATLL